MSGDGIVDAFGFITGSAPGYPNQSYSYRERNQYADQPPEVSLFFTRYTPLTLHYRYAHLLCIFYTSRTLFKMKVL